MRYNALIVLCVILAFLSCKSIFSSKVNSKTIVYSESDYEPTVEIERFGQFPGGEEEFLNFIDQNINKSIVGDSTLKPNRALFNFCIDTLGRVCNIKIIHSYSQLVDNECIRVLSIMPLWSPSYFLRNNQWNKDTMRYSMPFKIPWNRP